MKKSISLACLDLAAGHINMLIQTRENLMQEQRKGDLLDFRKTPAKII